MTLKVHATVTFCAISVMRKGVKLGLNESNLRKHLYFDRFFIPYVRVDLIYGGRLKSFLSVAVWTKILQWKKSNCQNTDLFCLFNL